MPSALKANCPTRIALKVKSISDSRIILDHKGAEELAGKGDAILSRSDGTEERFQAGYISPEGLDNVLAHCVSIPIHESFFDRIKGR
jgi:S-DNA-T family DNA segregation ATPase FtsK/SpoIIIE